MTRALIIFAICLLPVFFGNSARCQTQNNQAADQLDVLIDVSGSMKQNDPHNLRIDASQLLINLLPDGSKVSLWLFAEKSEPLIASDAVDGAWRQQALKASRNIHSRGLFTHIEDAIQTVMQNAAGSGEKHIILLTDGMVDISKDIMVSADSRERILSEWIPKLQQQNIKVHTIALSDQADKELLEKLAFDTGGWSEAAESAEQLQRIFLKMAQKAAPKDTLPLTDNRFSVDSSIKEFSVIVFKKPQSKPTQLIAPDRKKIDKHDASVSWLENAGYDLITAKQPQTGDWLIEAAIDPDNQVMILTDLKMQTSELANFVGEKETVPLEVYFTETDKLITRSDFLGLVSLSLSVDQQPPIAMPAVVNKPGYFNYTLAGLPQGKHTLTIVGDGKTFKREIVRDIEVIAVTIRVEKQIDAEKREVTLKLLPDPAVLDTSALVITATIQQADKAPESREMTGKDGDWSIKLADLAPGTTTVVNFHAMAKTVDGNAITPALAPVKLDDSLFQAAEPHPAHTEPTPAAEQTGHEQTSEEATKSERLDNDDNWGLIIAIVLAVNLLAIAAGIFIYKAMKKANIERQQQLLERLA